MQLISKYNKGIRYPSVNMLLLFLLKDKKGTTIVNAFQSILNNSKRKPNKIWVDQGSEFHNKSFKKWLKDNNIKMKCIQHIMKEILLLLKDLFKKITLKNKIYKHMTAISKNVYFDVSNDIVDKYNNTYHKTIKMRPNMSKMILLLNIMKNLMKKTLNLKIFLLKDMLLSLLE